MGGRAAGIVGREVEVAEVAAFVSSMHTGAGSLVLEGPAGIGKTTIWRTGLEEARAQGVRVLAAQPAANEAGYVLVALGDLLDGVPDDALADLPEPQRRALRVARALEEATEESTEPRLLGVALLGVLRRLAEDGPLLVAVDDLQWLDAASAAALEFASRRLAAEPVRILATRRAGEAPTPGAFAGSVRVLPIGPLSIGALQRLLASRIELQQGRRELRRIWEVSGGNPFFALELGRLLAARQSEPALGDRLPIPTDLGALLRERLAALGSDARDVLHAAALLAEPTLELLEAVSGPDAFERLSPAIDKQIVALTGTRVRFTHPLLAAAVADGADPLATQELHRRLAEVVHDQGERAFHLALSTEPPDDDVADALEQAARQAAARGSLYAASELGREASRFTVDDRERARRLLDSYELELRLGSFVEVAPALEAQIDALPDATTRARALHLLARAHYGGARAEELTARALADAGDEPRLRSEILIAQASYSVTGLVGDAVAAERSLREAVALAERAGDEDLAGRARGNLEWVSAVLGRELAPAPARSALRRQMLPDDVERARAVQLMWRGETERARTILFELRKRAEEVGEEWAQLMFTLHLFELETRRGDWPAAAACNAELESAAAGLERAQTVLLRTTALLAAVRGEREQVEQCLDAVTGTLDTWQELETIRAAGLAALAVGDAERAAGWLRTVHDAVLSAHFGDPGALPAAPDLVEALVLLGREDEASDVLAWLEARGEEQRHAWALAVSARCRGLLHRDEQSLCLSLERHERLSLPFERGRTLLALGALLRRAHRRAEARSALEQAAAIFARVEAPPWLGQARSELARIAGRAPSGSALTPAEQRVATLVAEGRTKKEVAAALFLSVHTVDSTLRRVYAKLGVSSRAELARRYP